MNAGPLLQEKQHLLSLTVRVPAFALPAAEEWVTACSHSDFTPMHTTQFYPFLKVCSDKAEEGWGGATIILRGSHSSVYLRQVS